MCVYGTCVCVYVCEWVSVHACVLMSMFVSGDIKQTPHELFQILAEQLWSNKSVASALSFVQ